MQNQAPSKELIQIKGNHDQIKGNYEFIESFYKNSQDIIAKYYLQPLPQEKNGEKIYIEKENLQDGHITREQHGAMHVARVQFWSLILYKFIKDNMSEHVSDVLKFFEEKFNINEELIVYLIRYAALFHDAAREDEFQDRWDDASGLELKKFLISKNISQEVATLFAKVIEFKDNPSNFVKFLKESEIKPENHIFCDFIRKIICMSDCLDIIRCVRKFYLSNVINVFEMIPGYNKSVHLKKINDLSKVIHKIILEQKDILFAAGAYSLPHKVVFEHAPNACSAVGNYINKYFNLSDEKFLDTSFYKGQPGFNPLIHGTSSAALPLLARTGKMLPVLELNKQTGLFPLSGELHSTAFGGPWDHLDVKGSAGAFGRKNAQGKDVYNFEKVLEYSKLEAPCVANELSNFREYLSDFLRYRAKNINKVMLTLGRARQLGANIINGKGNSQSIGKSEVDTLIYDLDNIIQYYYFIKLIGEYIFPNYSVFDDLLDLNIEDDSKLRGDFNKHIDRAKNKLKEAINSSDKLYERIYSSAVKETFEQFKEGRISKIVSDVKVKISTEFHFSKLIEKFGASEIKPKDVFENPTEKKIDEMLDIISFKNRKLFASQKSSQVSKYQCYGWLGRNFTFDQYLKGSHQNPSISPLVSDLFNFEFKDEEYIQLGNSSSKIIEILKDRQCILRGIIDLPNGKEFYTNKEKELIKKNFPIIFACPENRRAHMCDYGKQEFRFADSVRLGEDITIMATDCKENKETLNEFINCKDIKGIKIMLINELNKINYHEYSVCGDFANTTDVLGNNQFFEKQPIVDPGNMYPSP